MTATRELERTRNGAKNMERTLEAAKVEIAGLQSTLADAQQDNVSLLHLLALIREACGDNGERMQDELVEYIRDEWQGHISHIAMLKVSLGKERQEADALLTALKDCQTVAIMRGDSRLPDCIDNTGKLYQSAHLAALLEKK